jgi:hypothetical protein
MPTQTLPPFPPGPYRYQRSTNGLDDTVDVYAPGIENFLFSVPFSDEADQAEALARVFTASPSLLSACKLALAAMEAALEAHDPQARTQIEWEAEPLATLRAAIREAEAPLDPLFAYLDANSIKFEEFGCFVSLSEDNRTIYWCPALADGRPEPADYFDTRHMNWGEVTAPVPGFLDKVNSLFGTAFQPGQFAGR